MFIFLMVCSVASSDEHRFSLDGQSKQFITINVNSINPKFKSFGEHVMLSSEVNYCSVIIFRYKIELLSIYTTSQQTYVSCSCC